MIASTKRASTAFRHRDRPGFSTRSEDLPICRSSPGSHGYQVEKRCARSTDNEEEELESTLGSCRKELETPPSFTVLLQTRILTLPSASYFTRKTSTFSQIRIVGNHPSCLKNFLASLGERGCSIPSLLRLICLLTSIRGLTASKKKPDLTVNHRILQIDYLLSSFFTSTLGRSSPNSSLTCSLSDMRLTTT